MVLLPCVRPAHATACLLWLMLAVPGVSLAAPPIDEAVKESIIWLSEDYGQVGAICEGMARVQRRGKWGFIDRRGKEIIPPQYDDARDFEGGAAAVRKGGKWGFLDYKGQVIVPFQYDGVRDYREGMAPVREGKLWGFINHDGKVVVPPQYQGVRDFHEGRAGAMLDNRCGYINSKGEVVIPFIYARVRDFNEERAAVSQAGYWLEFSWIMIDKQGRKIPMAEEYYNAFYPFSDGLAKVLKGTGRIHCSFVDRSGKTALKTDFLVISGFRGGLCCVEVSRDKGNWPSFGYMNKKGEIVFKVSYDHAEGFVDGMARVARGKEWGVKWGFIDDNGKEKVAPRYEEAADYCEGLARVGNSSFFRKKWGFVDKNGRELVRLKYDSASDFHEGMAVVKLDGKWGLMVNPLTTFERKKNLRSRGLFVGTVKNVRGHEVLVAGKSIGNRVFMGDRLFVEEAGKEGVYFSAVFPMMTVVKCRGNARSLMTLKKGMKVYKMPERKEKTTEIETPSSP